MLNGVCCPMSNPKLSRRQWGLVRMIEFVLWLYIASREAVAHDVGYERQAITALICAMTITIVLVTAMLGFRSIVPWWIGIGAPILSYMCGGALYLLWKFRGPYS